MSQGSNPITEKLQEMEKRFLELEELILKPEIMQNGQLYGKYIKEHGSLSRLVVPYREFNKVQSEIEEAKEMIETEDDPEMKELAVEEIETLEKKKEELNLKLQELLITDAETDQKNVIVEIRSGTGGDEASLFTGDLFQMYVKYAEKKDGGSKYSQAIQQISEDTKKLLLV